MFIEDKLDELFLELAQERYLIGLTSEGIIKRLSYYLAELNAIHPFREGNGRTQRMFIEYLSNISGFHVDFSEVTSDEMVEASIESFLKNYEKMDKIFAEITNPISKKEQEYFINVITSKNSEIRRIYEHTV